MRGPSWGGAHHNDVIIYLALGYEVLRKRKCDRMTHSTLSACLFLATASYLVIVYTSRSLHDVSMLTSPSSSIFSCWINLRHTYIYHTYSPSAQSAYVTSIFTIRRHLKQYKKATRTHFTHSSARQPQRHYSSSARQLQPHYYIMASNNVDELQNLERIEELCRNLREQQEQQRQQSITLTG